MPAAKRNPERKSRSGRNVSDAERHTTKLQLRVPPSVAAHVRAESQRRRMSSSAYVALLVMADAAPGRDDEPGG